MPTQTPTDPSTTMPGSDGRGLAAALIFLAAILFFVFLSSCGTQDLTFPGQVPFTQTGQPTSTPVPTTTG